MRTPGCNGSEEPKPIFPALAPFYARCATVLADHLADRRRGPFVHRWDKVMQLGISAFASA